MRQWRMVAAFVAMALLVLASLLLSAWIVAEEAELAPPMDATIGAAADRWSGQRSASPALESRPQSAPEPAGPERTPRSAPEPPAPERCPATLFVETPDGVPVAGSVSLPGERGWVPLGAEGEADWPARRCGHTGTVRLREAQTRGFPLSFDLAYEDTDEVTLVVAARAEAWVRPVNAEGQPIEADVHPGVLQEDGWVHVQERSASVWVTARVSGERGGAVEVPLDGAEHDVVVPRDRRVDVTLLCDQCPGYLSCSRNQHLQGPACEGEDSTYSCLCPRDGAAVVVLRSPSALLDWQEETQALAIVPEGEDRVEVDVRGELGSVQARVEVPSGSSVVVHLARSGPARVEGQYVEDMDGLVEIEGILPGDWELVLMTVTVRSKQDVRREETRVPFRLEPGASLDLGVLSP